jgi:hypothetical protein
MAYRKLKLAALMMTCTIAGIIGGATGGTWLFLHVYGNAGDFAASRVIDSTMLLIDGSGKPYSQAEVYQNALRSLHHNTVYVGLAYGTINNPGYPRELTHLLGHVNEHPELDSYAGTNDLDGSYARFAPAVRTCILRTGSTADQVRDCSVEAVNRLRDSQMAPTSATGMSSGSSMSDHASALARD